ncbi:hypothetical protein F4703DRAFT_1508793 [Phycomyces blakesleeanus]
MHVYLSFEICINVYVYIFASKFLFIRFVPKNIPKKIKISTVYSKLVTYLQTLTTLFSSSFFFKKKNKKMASK